jgi:hypothetical protein
MFRTVGAAAAVSVVSVVVSVVVSAVVVAVLSVEDVPPQPTRQLRHISPAIKNARVFFMVS